MLHTPWSHLGPICSSLWAWWSIKSTYVPLQCTSYLQYCFVKVCIYEAAGCNINASVCIYYVDEYTRCMWRIIVLSYVHMHYDCVDAPYIPGGPSNVSHFLVPFRSYSFLGMGLVVHQVNTSASVVYQLFAVYFVKVTHGVVTSAECAILLQQGNAPTPLPQTPSIPWYKDIFLFKVHVYYYIIISYT